MLPFKLFRAKSFKYEILVVACVLFVALGLPVASVVSVTNIEALDDDGVKLYTGSFSTTNTYFFGYCTFWAALRREQISKPIPNNWHDANGWDEGAIEAGYRVDKIPEVGSIMQTNRGKEGHVAFIEEVYADGSWKVSEMNVKGWNIISERTFKASQADDFNFIH